MGRNLESIRVELFVITCQSCPAAIDVLQTYSLFLNNQFVDFNSGIE